MLHLIYCRCPKCRNEVLSTHRRRDHIDGFSINPLRRILGLVGAPIRYCMWCRFQFHDPRPIRRIERAGT